MVTHQQIIEGKKQFSELKEDNFDGAMTICVLHFRYVFNCLSNSPLQIGTSAPLPKGTVPDVIANGIRHCIGQQLDAFRLNDEQYQNIRLACDENDECGLDVVNEKQRQQQLREAINLEGQVLRSACPHHH